MNDTELLLSILIPTVDGREEQFDRIYNKCTGCCEGIPTGIEYMFGDIVRGARLSIGVCEIVYLKDNKEITIGEKREMLYNEAHGLYSFMIDDDDDIADNAIQLILQAIKRVPEVDCITFEEYIDIDGKIQRSNHSLKYDDWHDNFDGFDYVRTPFFKSVIRTDIARSVPIPYIRFGEDHQWAQALKPHLKSEIHIDEQLYRYIHRSSDVIERYGLDRD